MRQWQESSKEWLKLEASLSKACETHGERGAWGMRSEMHNGRECHELELRVGERTPKPLAIPAPRVTNLEVSECRPA